MELLIKDVLNLKEGEKVKIKGWVYRIRKLKDKIFIVLRDSSDILQCLAIRNKFDDETWKNIDKIGIESSLIIEGKTRKDKRAVNGVEIDVDKIDIINIAKEFPITEFQSTELLLDYRHLWIRSRKLTEIMKIRHNLLKAAREFFYDRGFYEVSPPIITGSACEGGATQFEINYFDEKAYLSQSAQLYLEALIYSLEKVFSITPSFRAEPHRTSRHLAEYWHIEPEVAWLDFEGLLKLEEDFISYICSYIATNNEKELKFLGRDPEDLFKVKPPFPRITYDEAIKRLNKIGMKIPWGKDLRTLEEEKLTKNLEKPLIVTHYPREIKAFYMKDDPKNKKVVLCNDMLAPNGYGEIIGGSERENDIEILKEKLIAAGEKLENYKWYLDLRLYGAIPHSGFGAGVERILRWICKLDHIRDAIPFPRTIRRKYP
ncbi:MAG: asparagine--tRNA ligase [Candidatus Pacearchaeota archaeon]